MPILKNRQAEIKNKGFNMAPDRNEDVYANPALDFSKIKVGLKTLDDAIVNVGDLNKMPLERCITMILNL